MTNSLRALLTLCALCVSILASGQLTQSFFVSPDGDDNGTGTIESPFATLQGARDAVTSFQKANPATPITVYFRGGKYYMEESVEFNSEHSGTAKAPIVYQAYPGEVPSFLGGKRISVNWQSHKNGIYKTKVPVGLVFESLFINDNQQVLARYPNYDPEIRIFNGTAEDCLSKDRVKKWKDPTGGYFHVIHSARWGGFHFRITGKKNKSEVTMEGGWQNNRPEGGLHKEMRFVENIFEELDAEGEWYLDRKNSTLFFLPPAGLDLNSAEVEVAYLENFITVKGSQQNPVRHLTFDGIKFSRSVRTFMKTNDPLLRSDWTIYRGGAIMIEDAEKIAIRNCELTQVGSNGIFVNHYAREVEITGNYIHDTGASAICFVGDTAAVRNPKYQAYGKPVSDEELETEVGPRSPDYPANSIVDNNLIHDIGRVEKQVAGVQISMAMDITVSRNSIYNTPRAGINIGEGAWGGHLLEYNDVFNTVLETSDHGSFNSWGRDRFWMANNGKTETRVAEYPASIFWDATKTTIIRNNRFRCDHGWDIDLDDGSSNYHIYNNLCLKNGIKLREGYYRKVENNMVLNNGLHPHVWLKDNHDIVRGNIFGSRYFPIRIDYWSDQVDRNWFLSEADLIETQTNGIEPNSLAGMIDFADPENGDFRVVGSSRVYELGWKNFAMDEFGVQHPMLKPLADTPEIPAILQLTSATGTTIDFFGGQLKNLTTEAELSATGMGEFTGVLVVVIPVFGNIVDVGLKDGDVILSIDGKEISNTEFFTENNSYFDKNQSVEVVVWRDQQKVTLSTR